MNNALTYLGLARKAGALAIGEEACGESCKAGKAKLLLLAADASANAQKRAESFLHGRRASFMVLSQTKEELSSLLNRAGCSMVCFTDLSFASQFAKLMATDNPQWNDTAAQLAARYEKFTRRKSAPKKH